MTAGQGHLAMLAFSMLVSLSFFLGHFVAKDVDPGALMAVRFVVASVFLAVLLPLLGGRAVWTRFWRFLLIGGCMGVYFITMFEALRLTTTVSTAAIFTLTPLLAAGFGLVLVGQRTGLWTLSALMIGGAGALWVIFRADLAALLRFEIGPGEAVFMIGVVAHGAVPVLMGKLCHDVPPLASAFGTTLGAMIATGLYAAPEIVATDWAAQPSRVWWVLAYLAIITTAITFFLLRYAAVRLPGAKVMAYTYLVPSWVVLWEGLTLGRWPAPALALGIGLTMVALLMLLRADG